MNLLTTVLMEVIILMPMWLSLELNGFQTCLFILVHLEQKPLRKLVKYVSDNPFSKFDTII